MDKRMNTQIQVNCIKKEMVGFKYRHFKGGVYIVTDIAVHSETEEPMVIYKNLNNPDLVWCRPLGMFMSEVNHEKYPDVKQTMRFEKITENMKIYFEDGKLPLSYNIPIDHCLIIDAVNGASQNITELDMIKEKDPSATIYTNSILALNNKYAWNKELDVPEIYIRSEGTTGIFTRIDKLTDRELREGHDIAKMYINGEFSNLQGKEEEE